MMLWLEPPRRKPRKKASRNHDDLFRGRYPEYVSRVRAYLEKVPPAPPGRKAHAHNLRSAAVLPECMCKWCKARRHPPEPMPKRESPFGNKKPYNLADDCRDFDRYLRRQTRFLEPAIPGFPLIEWLAVQIYYWYSPVAWAVDLDADDWLSQLREADERNSFSMAECRAQAEKRGYVIPLLEEMMLQYITREPLFSKPEVQL